MSITLTAELTDSNGRSELQAHPWSPSANALRPVQTLVGRRRYNAVMPDDSQESTPSEPDSFALQPADDPHTPRPEIRSEADLAVIRAALQPIRSDDERRFTLTGLFALMTFASVVFALGSYLPPAIFAGVTGLATLVGMVVLSLLNGPPMVIQLGWWLLLAIYLAAIGWAVWA